MDSLYCSLEGKLFTALLNGLSKRLFFNEESFTNEYLAQQLYGSLEIEPSEAQQQINAYEQILLKAAESAWDGPALEDKLKRLTNISSESLRLLVIFWNSEKDKILKSKILSSRWNDSFEKLSWRIDVNAISKSSEINEPMAYIKILAKPSGSEKLSSVDFEMMRGEVTEMSDILDTIQRAFDEAS